MAGEDRVCAKGQDAKQLPQGGLPTYCTYNRGPILARLSGRGDVPTRRSLCLHALKTNNTANSAICMRRLFALTQADAGDATTA